MPRFLSSSVSDVWDQASGVVKDHHDLVGAIEEEDNSTGFRTPLWNERCDLNHTHFVPECLPEKIYERNNTDDWVFAEICGVRYASAKVANQIAKRDLLREVVTIIYDSLVSQFIHFIAGMALAGIFLRKRKDKASRGYCSGYDALREKEEEERFPRKPRLVNEPRINGPKPRHNAPIGGCERCMKKVHDTVLDYAYVVLTLLSLLYVAAASALTMIKFWRKASEYFSGVWMLPVHPTSFHCRSVLLQEFIYYQDLLKYLTLASFTLMDLFIVGVPILGWLGLTCNVCCCHFVCVPLGRCLKSFLSCLKSFLSCAWFKTFCLFCRDCVLSELRWLISYVSWVLSELRWLLQNPALWWGYFTSMCWACVKNVTTCVKSCCTCVKNMFESCCTCVKNMFGGCVKECCSLTWLCRYLLCHCSCVCCCNISMKWLIMLIVVSMIYIIFIPLFLYLAAGMCAWLLAVALTVAILLVPILMGFWAATQAVTAVGKVMDSVRGGGDPPEFMGPMTYYSVYFDELVKLVIKQCESFRKAIQDVQDTIEGKKQEEHVQETIEYICVYLS